MNKTEQFYKIHDGVFVKGPFPRPKRYGAKTSDERLAEDGIYRLWVIPPTRMPERASVVIGVPVFDGTRAVRGDHYQTWEPDDLRQQHLVAIEDQIPEFTLKEYVRDSELRDLIEQYSKAAEKKVRELEALGDDRLSGFSSDLGVRR